MIRITAKRAQGFYRCGLFHPAQPTDHPDGRFTPEQMEVLETEPNLTVESREGNPENPLPSAPGPADAVGEQELKQLVDGHWQEIETITAQLEARETALAEREAALDTRAAALAEREAALETREAAPAERGKPGKGTRGGKK